MDTRSPEGAADFDRLAIPGGSSEVPHAKNRARRVPFSILGRAGEASDAAIVLERVSGADIEGDEKNQNSVRLEESVERLRLDIPHKVDTKIRQTYTDSVEGLLSVMSSLKSASGTHRHRPNVLTLSAHDPLHLNQACTMEAARKFADAMQESLERNMLCICCGDVSFDVRLLACGHVYCKLCLEKWLATGNSKHCPSCRVGTKPPYHAAKKLDELHADMEILRCRFKQVLDRSETRALCRQSLEDQQQSSTAGMPNLTSVPVGLNRLDFILTLLKHQQVNSSPSADQSLLYSNLFPNEVRRAREEFKKLYTGRYFGFPFSNLTQKDILLSIGVSLFTFAYFVFTDDSFATCPEERTGWVSKTIYGMVWIYLINLYAVLIRDY